MPEENASPSHASPVPVEPPPGGVGVRYVGFCDILGFSNRIQTDFDGTLDIYKRFGETFSSFSAKGIAGVEVTIYSDAVLITGASLGPVAAAIQNLWFIALANDLMIRGAITKGRYWEQRQGNHMFVASDALVRAVKLERSVGIPAVVIADDVEIPDEFWLHRFQAGLLQTPILHFRDRNIVNPFNTFWFASASARAVRLMAASPSHRDKYLWFLALHEAVGNGLELIPSVVLARFVRDGILKLKIPLSEAPREE
jgi:hypothetical protein